MDRHSAAHGYGQQYRFAGADSQVARRVALAAVLLAISAAGQTKPLTVERAALHQFEDGPELAATYEFVPGETLHFSCHVAGFKILDKDDKQSMAVSWVMRAVDPSGVLIEKEISGRDAEGVTPQDKDWTPKITADLIAPGFAPTGIYHIQLKVHDEIANKDASFDMPFRVRGHSVEASDKLVAQNFEFLRAEDDKVPMHPAIYHQGDMLWARFDIAGYQFGGKNHFSVDYGLAILNDKGDQMFSQLVAAEEANESFYPQRYVPGVLSLHLDSNVPKGLYTLVVIVRDKVGNTKIEQREPFQVE